MVVPREDNLEVHEFKGLDLSAHPSLIPDNTFSILRNMEFGNQNEMSRRRGLFIFRDFTATGGAASTPAIGNALITFHGTFAVDANDNYKIYSAGGVPYVHASAGTPTAVAGLPGGFDCIGVTQYKNIWYFMSSANGIWKATPSAAPTATAVAGSPNAAAFLNFKERLWVVQRNANQFSTLSSTIWYSGPANFDSWDPANIQNVADGDGDVITNIVGFSDRLIVFKKNTIWNIYLQGGEFPVSAVRLMVRGKGAISTRATVSVNNIIYFIAADGVWKTDGSTFVDISAPLVSLFLHGPSLYAYDQLDWISYFDHHLYLRLSYVGAPSSSLIAQGGNYYMMMNIDTGAWSETVFSPFNTIGQLTRPVIGRNFDGTVVFWQGGTGRLWTRSEEHYVDDQNFNGGTGVGVPQAIPVTLRTKRFSINNATRVKRLKYTVLGMDGVISTPQYYYTVDGHDRDIYNFDPSAVNQYGAYKIPGCGYFRTFEFNFADSGQDRLRLDFLHFIMHLKRQLAESPR